MFSIGLFDLKKKKKFFLIRDRFGTKPLYYFIKKNIIYFLQKLSLYLFATIRLTKNITNFLTSELYPKRPQTFFHKI